MYPILNILFQEIDAEKKFLNEIINQENDTIIQMIVLYKSQFFMLNFIFNN